MPFSFDTKPNLNNRKFEQLSSECLNFSGTTSIFGSLCVIPTGIIDSFSGYKLSGYTFLDSSHICISSVFVGANSGANNRGYNEIAIGYNSLYNSCGNSNIAVGCNSLCSNTTGVGNIGIGVNTLLSSVSNSYNIAIGDNSLCTNNGGIYNIGLGYNTLKSNTIGCNNIGIGLEALKSNIGGKFNIGLGYKVLTNNTCGENNVGVGDSVLYCNISGNTNVGVGVNVLYNNKGGCSNTGIGNNVLYLNTFGQANTSIGYNSLSSNTIGCYNNAFGCGTLKSNISGCYNIGFGDRALYANTCGCLNIAMGSNALSGNTLGVSNIGIGNNSLQKNLTGNYNLGIGENVLCNNTSGCHNMGFGYYTLLNNTTGCNNVGIGYNILRTNTTGCNNLGLGYNVLYNNTTGCNNIALGFCTLCCNTIGLNNIGIGYGSLKTNTNGCGNISIGCFNLYNNVSGSNNVSIGTCAGYAETGSNKFYVANNATCNLIYGEFDNNIITLPKLKLCETPTSGVNTDDFLIWNSIDKSVKKINISGGIVNTVTGHTQQISNIKNIMVTGATSSIDNAIARFDGITGKLIQNSGVIIDDNGNMGFGVTPTAQITQTSTAALESAPLGAELLTSSNWTTTEWTGDFINGFTHTTGNVTPLTNTLAALNATLYQIAFTVTNRTAGGFTITFGNETSGNYTSSNAWGVKTTGTGTLSITPTTDFNGTIVLSIKRITGTYAPTYQILDSTGISTLEIRSSLNTLNNTFIGKGAGSYNTTGSNNSAQGYYALFSNTTGSYNSAQGFAALRNNTTGSQNSAQGVFALQNNTTGSQNSAQGSYTLQNNTTGSYNSAQGFYVLRNNTTGSNNSAQGYYALLSNTTGSNNSAQGAYVLQNNTTGSNNSTQGVGALYSNTTGNNNSAQGGYALNSNTTGNNNSAQGFHALLSNTTGSQNSAQGVSAGRFLADGVTGNQTSNNSVFLGANTKSKQAGQTNEIVIGANAIGNGSNTVTIGNSSVIGTYLQGNLILSTTPQTGLNSDGILVWNSTDKCLKQVTSVNCATNANNSTCLNGQLSSYYAIGTHVHGNVNNGGCLGTTSGCTLTTSTNGCIIATSFVNCAKNATNAVNSTCLNGQLASYYSIATHAHGNITNGGCLGTASGCVLVTTTGGLITTASSVTCATNATTANNSTCLNGQLASYYAVASNVVCSANNGLNKIGNNVRLGGALTGNTGISGAYTMGFSNSILNLTGSTCVNISGPTKLLSTPSSGAGTDSILVWDSTDKTIKTITCACLNTCNITTANNGLTKSGPNVRLGGALTGDTTITGAYTLSLCSGALMNTQCGYQISGDTILKLKEYCNIFIGLCSGLNDNTLITNSCNNIGIGKNVLNSTFIGKFNIGIGNNTLSNSSSNYNIAIGECVLYSNCGYGNTSVGYLSLYSNISGCENTAIGRHALNLNVNGSNNVAIGTYSGYYFCCTNLGSTCGSCNIYIGNCSKSLNNNSINQIVIGHNAVGNGNNTITLGNDSITTSIIKGNVILSTTPSTGSVGDSYLVWNSTDKCIKSVSCSNIISGATVTANNGLNKIGQNVRLGGALTGNTTITGAYTLSLCNGALMNTQCGYQISGNTVLITKDNGYSLFVGVDSGISSTSAFSVGVGRCALKSASGSGNIGIGYRALSVSSGGDNIGIGCQALQVNTIGSGNVAIGGYTLSINTIGSNNVAIGNDSLSNNGCGSYNIGIGIGALTYNCYGWSNIGIGGESLSNNECGSYNIGIGIGALTYNCYGCCNIGYGYKSLFLNNSGCDNIAIGNRAGCCNIYGSNNVFIGNASGLNIDSSNKFYVANNATCNLIYGDFTGNTVTLPKLKLCETPATGTGTDSILVWNSTDKCVKVVTNTAEANTASNLGTGCGIYSSKLGVDLRFKSLKAGNNISMSSDANEITICSTGSGGISTANNGLTKSGTNVRLGGALTGNTGISGAYTMGFSNSILNLTGSTCVNISGPTKLLSTPGTGASTDGILVWNSTDKTIKQVSSVSCATNATTAVNSTCLNGQLASYYAVGTHVHGNITNGGCLGTISGCVLVTTTGGLITTASSVSCATNATTANNSTCLNGQLASYYATATHAHGNITNGGCLGTTSGCVLVTTTGGLITTASSVSCATTATNSTCLNGQLASYYAVATHGHGNITNTGCLGTTSGCVLVTTTGGLITTASSVTCATNATTANNSTCLNGQLASYYAVSSNVICSANNGLNKIGTNVRLGGALTGNTTIGGTYFLNINDNKINVNTPYYTHNRPLIYYNCFYNSYYIGSEGALGSNTVGLGYSVLNTSVDVGDGNTAIGGIILNKNVTGVENVGVGTRIMDFGETLCYNIGIGNNILRNAEDSYYNIGIGNDVLHINKGHNNIAIGAQALSNLNNGNINDNIAIGVCSGIDSAGNNSVYIGQCAGFGNQDSNRLYIANNGACALIYGEFDNNIVRLPYLKLCNAPSTGVDTDQLLTWNSTDCCVKSINNTFSSLWKSINASRASNTTFTVTGNQTPIFNRGVMVKWIESGVIKCAMVVSSSYSSVTTVTTVTIVGDTCNATAYDFRYTFMGIQKYEFKVAGTIGQTSTNVAQAYYVREEMRVIGGEISVGTLGTSNATTVNIINNTGTVTIISPSLTTSAYNSTPTAPASSGLTLALNDKITENITSVHTTPSVDLYVDLLVFPSRLLKLS